MTSELPPEQREWERNHFPQPTIDATLLTERIEQTKQEILDDVASGQVPEDVASFSELHDHVDANTYGGLCDEPVDGTFGWNADGTINIDQTNALQVAIDAWIKDGGITKAILAEGAAFLDEHIKVVHVQL